MSRTSHSASVRRTLFASLFATVLIAALAIFQTPAATAQPADGVLELCPAGVECDPCAAIIDCGAIPECPEEFDCENLPEAPDLCDLVDCEIERCPAELDCSDPCNWIDCELLPEPCRDFVPDQECIDAIVAAAKNIAETIRGDANCDNVRNIIDALVIARHSVGIPDHAGCAGDGEGLSPDNADVDGDGAVNIIDALVIAQCVAGIDNPHC